jgi:YesN/AraC family two-component response regulator
MEHGQVRIEEPSPSRRVSEMPLVPSPHLLVVDDEAPIREALTAALAQGYAVHTAASGAEACAVLRSHPVAVIILDAVLGDENGLDSIPSFRALSPAPIVVLTGYGSEDLAIRALRARVAEYLKKPVSLPDLHAVLERLLPREQRPSELIASACRHLDAYPPKEFRAAALARQLGVGEIHLRRLFQNAYGKTPRQYLAEVRVRRAALLLRTTERSIKEIALELGYAKPKLLDRTFTRLMRVRPQAWRRQNRATRAGQATPL